MVVTSETHARHATDFVSEPTIAIRPQVLDGGEAMLDATRTITVGLSGRLRYYATH